MNLKFLTVLYTIIAISACENSEFQGSKAPPKPQPTSAPVVKQTQGSFSLYTEPKDPAPLQDYTIVIEVSLPSNITTYNASDLVGCVIGTDKYVYVVNRGVYNYGLGSQFDGIKTIPGSAQQVNSCNQLSAAAATNFQQYAQQQQFSFDGKKATLRIRIPGGEKQVRDTINIRSNQLNEQQTFVLTF